MVRLAQLHSAGAAAVGSTAAGSLGTVRHRTYAEAAAAAAAVVVVVVVVVGKTGAGLAVVCIVSVGRGSRRRR